MNQKNIIAAVIASLSVFGFFVMVLPEYDGIMSARELLDERKNRLTERSALIAQVATLDSQYDQNVSNISKLDVLLPTNKQPDQVVSGIQDIVSQSGLILSEMSITDASTQQSDAPYKSIVVSLRFFGRYEQFFSFVRLLEQSLRLYDIQSLNISESTVSGAFGNDLNFEVKINANSIK